MDMVKITESAQVYLVDLLKKQDVEGVGVRVFIIDAGTPQAETCISFCRPGEEEEGDEDDDENLEEDDAAKSQLEQDREKKQLVLWKNWKIKRSDTVRHFFPAGRLLFL